jgi:hypothetical protein
MNSPDEYQSAPGATPYDNFTAGKKDSDGRAIKTVIGRHRQFIVYITEENYVAWNYDQLPARLRPAITELQQLNGIAKSNLGSKSRPQVAALLGAALYAALLSPEGENPLSHFQSARNFIYSKCTRIARLSYELFSLFFGCIVIAIAFYLYKYLGTSLDFRTALLVGTAGGAIGSIVSIFQRGRNLKIDPFDSWIILGLQGLTRVALGAIFGMLLVVASKANIALGHFSAEPWALFGLSVGAGFTERWIPELLGAHSGTIQPGSERE